MIWISFIHVTNIQKDLFFLVVIWFETKKRLFLAVESCYGKIVFVSSSLLNLRSFVGNMNSQNLIYDLEWYGSVLFVSELWKSFCFNRSILSKTFVFGGGELLRQNWFCQFECVLNLRSFVGNINSQSLIYDSEWYGSVLFVSEFLKSFCFFKCNFIANWKTFVFWRWRVVVDKFHLSATDLDEKKFFFV